MGWTKRSLWMSCVTFVGIWLDCVPSSALAWKMLCSKTLTNWLNGIQTVTVQKRVKTENDMLDSAGWLLFSGDRFGSRCGHAIQQNQQGWRSMTLMQLATRRQSLLERAYSGFVDMAAWKKQLITDYLAIGANYNAAWCVRKVQQFLWIINLIY